MDLSDADADKYRTLIQYTESVKLGTASPEERRVGGRDVAHRQEYQHYDRLTDDQVDQLVTAYLQGSSTRKLASQFGCQRETVSKWLKSRGITMRHAALTNEQIDKAQNRYESGLSLTDVGNTIGADRTTVRIHLLRRGVRMRDTHGHTKS